MKLIAHRGLWSDKNSQNKFLGIKKALDSEKYDGVEFDIRVTKDKKYIINHDMIVHNTIIANTTSKYYRKLNISFLDDILKINTNKIFLLEIKDRNINVKELNNYLKKYSKNIYVMSFHNKVIDDLYKLDHTYKLGILNYILNSNENYEYDFICLLDSFTSKKIIKNYKNKNVEVFIYGKISKNFDHGSDVYYIVDPNDI